LKTGGIVKTRIVLIALLGCFGAATSSYASENSTKHAAKRAATPVATPVVQEAAPAPKTLEPQPSVPPQVTFQNGELTVVAQNSTMGDILKAIHTQTGAEIDLPGNGGERVVGHFGPGPARDVLSALLNGSHFNYVLLGSETNPEALDRVILMAKSSTPADSSPVQEATNEAPAFTPGNMAMPGAMGMMGRPLPGRPGMGQPNGNAANTQEVQGEDAAADDSADATDDSDSADADDQTDQTDDQQGDQAAADGEQPNQPGQQGVKTPEQLLQELQQQQQSQGVQQGMPQGGTNPPGMPPAGLAPHN